jgi:hypothetical protein
MPGGEGREGMREEIDEILRQLAELREQIYRQYLRSAQAETVLRLHRLMASENGAGK